MNKDLIILYSKQYEEQLMTQEAYKIIKDTMDNEDLQTHQKLFISPENAAYFFDFEQILTLEEVA